MIFFLQKHTQPALLPPLYQLLYQERPDDRTPRLLQEGGMGVPQEVRERVGGWVHAALHAGGSGGTAPRHSGLDWPCSWQPLRVAAR